MHAPSADMPPFMNRRLLIATGVILLHVFVLWALQSGLMRRAIEVIVPGEILSEFISPPAPPAPQPQTPAPQPVKQEVKPVVKSTPTPPLPAPTPEPAPMVVAAAPAPAQPAIEASTVATAPAAPQAPAPARIELPSSDAAYLNNPRPSYPALSRRLGEQGKVIVRVLIGVDGTAQQAEIAKSGSSGYERLDQAALATVRSWRYVPGKRNGVAEAMWFNVPINFVLE